ncbi:hypothetical protein VPH35_073700 [Triticum aestivum]
MCSAVQCYLPSALKFAGRCVDPRGAMQSSTWVHAARPTGTVQSKSVGASSTPPIPKPISLPPHTRAKRSLTQQWRMRSSPSCARSQCGRATDAVRQGDGCSAARRRV